MASNNATLRSADRFEGVACIRDLGRLWPTRQQDLSPSVFPKTRQALPSVFDKRVRG